MSWRMHYSSSKGVAAAHVLGFVLILLNSCFASAQEELASFDEIRDFIDNGVGVISTVLHFRHCESDDQNVTEGHFHVIEEFDQWLYFDYGNGTEKYRTTKYTLNEEGLWVFLIIEAFNDNNTWVSFQTLSPSDLSEVGRTVLNCPTGDGAHYFAHGKNRPSASLSDYNDLKTALLEGKHIFTKSEVSLCQGGDSLGFARLINGKSPIDFWEIHNNGLEGETIWLAYDFWVDDPYYLQASLVGVEKILISVAQDGSVTHLPIILDLITWEDGFTTPGIGFQCELGTSFRVYSPESAHPLASYGNFDELVSGLQADIEPEVMIDSATCLIDGSPSEFPVISSRNPGVWVLDSSEESRRVLMAVSYIASGTDGYGVAVHEQATIDEASGQVTIDINIIDPRNNAAILRTLQAVCTLGDGVVVRSVSRTRNVLETLDDVHAALFEGKRLRWQVDLSECPGLLSDPLQITLGGAFVRGTTLDPHANNGTFYAPMTELFQADDDLATFEWMNLYTYWFGSAEDSLHVFLAEYNYLWEDNLQGLGAWVCPIPSDKAYIFY